jgi:hypothetical protein
LLVKGLRGDFIHAVNVEGRDDVLSKVLILVITKDNHHVRVEVVYGGPHLTEGIPMPRLMLMGSLHLIVPLVLHSCRPVLGVLHLFGDPRALKDAFENVRVRLRLSIEHRGVVCYACTKNFTHLLPPYCGPVSYQPASAYYIARYVVPYVTESGALYPFIVRQAI